MPDKYHIETATTAGRFHRVGKYGSVDWREDCSRCTNCVKPRCLYDVYKHESEHNRNEHSAAQPLNECKACLSCVQGCTKGLLAVSLNPEFLALGDAYWKPDILATTWVQADTGRIPVSGAGYRGRFHGPGFDSIWTDMSEIVRPTRDGIHGREYISTMVEIGPKPMRLSFAADGTMLTPESALIELQIPTLLDVPPWTLAGKGLLAARVLAAKKLHTLAVVHAADTAKVAADLLPFVVPLLTTAEIGKYPDLLKQVKMIEIFDGADLADAVAQAQALAPQSIVAARIELQSGSVERVSELARKTVKVFHLCADLQGREKTADGTESRHIKDVLREIHGRLVKDGLRDEVTLIITGGIALAEHTAKAIICGADLVGVDVPLLVALGCRVCSGAHAGPGTRHCPAQIEAEDAAYAAQRMVNLMGAWHSQLIEVLGAMGIREIRRLRGEVGRAIFMEDIEREAFGDFIRK
jgi:hypothetical protein